jgi:acyl-CoA thioesterase-2
MSDRPEPTPEQLVAGMLRLLDVRPTGPMRFQGGRKPGGKGRVFGGQVIGQALMAATKTVAVDRLVHSLHAYFMRPGDEDYPIDYTVEADMDGQSFCNRRVVAWQKDKPILNLVASFHRDEAGYHHHAKMPAAPPPESLGSERDFVRASPERLQPEARLFLDRPTPLEFRVDGMPLFAIRDEPSDPQARMWFRTTAPVVARQAMQRVALAMASDASLIVTACLPHRVKGSTPVRIASIDHAVWFHSDVTIDDWMLYATDSPWAGHGRGLARGQIFARDGRLVASVAQEGLMRLRAD